MRTTTVSTRLNSDEAAYLDRVRGRLQRGRYMRELLTGRPPRPIPEINRRAYADLARATSNLNQIARRMNLGEHIERSEILRAIIETRDKLIGLDADDRGV